MLAVYLAHRGALVSYANGIVGDVGRSEDVVQEAWLRFGEAAEARPFEEPVGYLYRIVRNLAIDSRRRRLREERVLTSGPADAVLNAADDTLSPEAAATVRAEVQRLAEAMAELPERTRVALEMRRFGGCKLKDIADHLGVSVTTAHEIVAQGIDHCRRRVRSGS